MDHGRTQAYVPAVNGLLTYTGNGRGKRVLVVGSGCAGLGAAWHLNRAGWDVTLKEADSRFGGHANTIAVDGTEVDTGFMVYNALNYPNLMGLFEELGVAGLDTEMGFSVSLDDGAFEWCGDTLKGLCATRSNATNPAFYRMMRDILRFNTAAVKALSVPDHHPTRTQTVGEFLRVHGFSDAFTNLYLVPMTAAIWSSSARGILDFPAITLFTFLNKCVRACVCGTPRCFCVPLTLLSCPSFGTVVATCCCRSRGTCIGRHPRNAAKSTWTKSSANWAPARNP
jgi:hypothetical protein